MQYYKQRTNNNQSHRYTDRANLDNRYIFLQLCDSYISTKKRKGRVIAPLQGDCC
jgi:hypothetical protein